MTQRDELGGATDQYRPSSYVLNCRVTAVAMVLVLLVFIFEVDFFIHYSNQYIIGPKANYVLQHQLSSSSDVCSIFEVPISDPRSNLRSTLTHYCNTTGKRFSFVTPGSGLLVTECPGSTSKLFIFASPEIISASPLAYSISNPKWHDISSALNNKTVAEKMNLEQEKVIASMIKMYSMSPEAKVLAWEEVMFYPQQTHVWLWCDKYPDVNLVIPPPNLLKRNGKLYLAPKLDASAHPAANEDRKTLTSREIKDVEASLVGLEMKSRISSKIKESFKPIFDSVIIWYMDSLSRQHFDHFWKLTSAVLSDISFSSQQDGSSSNRGIVGSSNGSNGSASRSRPKISNNRTTAASSHTSFKFHKLHALGKNSAYNYPPLMGGLDGMMSSDFFRPNVQISRSTWLNDVAELMNFTTLAAVDECHFRCNNNCTKKLRDFNGYESGGFERHYMYETDNRPVAIYKWPSFVRCEAKYSKDIRKKTENMCPLLTEGHKVGRFDNNRFIGGRPVLEYVMDWFKVWMVSHRTNRRFAYYSSQSTHATGFHEIFDALLAQLLRELFFSSNSSIFNSQLFNTSNTAMILLADHGMQMHSEYFGVSGKIANKQPMAYFILPNSYVDTHPEESELMYKNMEQLSTPLDIHNTILYWLTGQKKPSSQRFDKQGSFAEKHGKNLHLDSLSPTRSCEDAGIYKDFCGCNVVPCNLTRGTVINRYHNEIARFINKKLLIPGKQFIDTCGAIHEDEIYPYTVPNTCMMNNDGSVVSDSVLLLRGRHDDVVLTVTMALKSNASSPSSYYQDYEVTDITTSSLYGATFHQCTIKMAASGVSSSVYMHLPSSIEQHCHCVPASWGKLLSYKASKLWKYLKNITV